MGKRLINLKKEIDQTLEYEPKAAIELAQKTAQTKFVGNLEAHVRLGIDPKKSDQTVRSTVTFPYSLGKTKKIAAFVVEKNEKEALDAGAHLAGGEELIKKIKESGQIDFDIAIAEPALMPKLAQIAKILGPKGLMPNPKTGTVSQDIKKVISEFKAGKTEFKNDESGNVHMTFGKSDMESSKLLENFEAFMKALSQSRPSNLKNEFVSKVAIHATMGPSIKVKT